MSRYKTKGTRCIDYKVCFIFSLHKRQRMLNETNRYLAEKCGKDFTFSGET